MSTTPIPDAPPEGWFPKGRLDLSGWRFDVITLLAVIGVRIIHNHLPPPFLYSEDMHGQSSGSSRPP